jgi:uncharacterized protein YndB with AHSA1/START domain
MTTAAGTDTSTRTVHVHRVYIHAPAQRVWDALLSPEWTDRYGYGGFVQSDLQAGSPFVTNAGSGMQEYGVTGPIVDGEVIESDAPRRFVQTWRMLMDDDLKAEGFTRLTYELVETDGVTRLTVTHDLTGAPKLAVLTSGEADDQPGAGGGGWPWVLSDLKSLLETGTAFSRAG